MVDDLSNLELSYGKANTGSTHHPTSLKHFDLIKTIFPEILRSVLVAVWLLAPVWRSIVGATHAKISGNNPDLDIASSFVKGADVHHPSEISQLENFLDDLEVYASLNGDRFRTDCISGLTPSLAADLPQPADLALCVAA